MNDPVNSFGFRVDRGLPVSLIDQVAGGLRHGIQTGRFAPGETLPSLLPLAEALGVSEIVTRRAVTQLKREGLVSARPGYGIRVRDVEGHPWRAHVLYAHWSGSDMYYHAVLSGAMGARLHAERVLVTDVQLGGEEAARGYPTLSIVLATRSVTLAVVEGPAEGVGSRIVEAGVRFVHIYFPPLCSEAVGGLITDASRALAELGRHGEACGIRRALLVRTPRGDSAFARAMRDAGVAVDILPAPPALGVASPEAVERGGFLAARDWLASASELPDALMMEDDWVARGVLTALLERGVRVPEDVQVITQSNRGMVPVFPKPLTRIEMTPRAHGELVADTILAALDGKSATSAPARLETEFIAGKTTIERKPTKTVDY